MVICAPTHRWPAPYPVPAWWGPPCPCLTSGARVSVPSTTALSQHLEVGFEAPRSLGPRRFHSGERGERRRARGSGGRARLWAQRLLLRGVKRQRVKGWWTGVGSSRLGAGFSSATPVRGPMPCHALRWSRGISTAGSMRRGCRGCVTARRAWRVRPSGLQILSSLPPFRVGALILISPPLPLRRQPLLLQRLFSSFAAPPPRFPSDQSLSLPWL